MHAKIANKQLQKISKRERSDREGGPLSKGRGPARNLTQWVSKLLEIFARKKNVTLLEQVSESLNDDPQGWNLSQSSSAIATITHEDHDSLLAESRSVWILLYLVCTWSVSVNSESFPKYASLGAY